MNSQGNVQQSFFPLIDSFIWKQTQQKGVEINIVNHETRCERFETYPNRNENSYSTLYNSQCFFYGLVVSVSLNISFNGCRFGSERIKFRSMESKYRNQWKPIFIAMYFNEDIVMSAEMRISSKKLWKFE